MASNWSWSFVEDADEKLVENGFKVFYGNFSPSRFKDWKTRSAPDCIVGAGVSSWCAMDEFELGKMHIAQETMATGMLWSSDDLDMRACIDRLPAIKSTLAHKSWGIGIPRGLPSVRPNARVVQIPVGVGDDLNENVVCAGASLVLKSVRIARDGEAITLNVQGTYESLIFVWAIDVAGSRTVHAGDQTHYPRESSESLAQIQIEFLDGMIQVDAARYDENISVLTSDSLLYHCPYHLDMEDGKRLFGYEWGNIYTDKERL